MRYCSKCGHELLDEAIVCVHCGCMIENNVRVPKKKVEKSTLGGLEKSSIIINFVYWILIVNALFWIVSALVNGRVYTDCSIDRYNNCQGWGYVYPEDEHATVAMVFASFSFLTAVGDVINSCLNKYGLKEKLSSIFKIIVSILSVISIALML